MKQRVYLILILIVGISACQPDGGPEVSEQFRLLTSDETGLVFENVLAQTPAFNVFAYMYFFNGGGVAAGDVNQDGWIDLYFTSNMGPNKLFLNEKGLKFRDVSEDAGVSGMEGWTSGVSMIDINGDDLLDIYVCQIGNYGVMQGHNQLYVCQGIENGVPVYREEAAKYGLDFAGFATQASFFDYDRDGDLDVFLLNHSLHQNGTFGRRVDFQGKQSELSGDRLLRNDSDEAAIQFTDVTTEAGIFSTVIGYGLGIVTGDVNLDGWPDVYIGNDFHENDYLYINQQDGTFKESLTEQMMHTSRFSMGVDMADINNDGWAEIFSLDMLPYDPYILKTSLGEDGFNIFQFKIGHGYNHQYARNNLQLNNRDGTFSEIGMYAGVYATDWSWSSLFLDFDHDGWQDLFISNGIPRRMNDIDYVNFRLGDEDIEWKTDNNYLKEDELNIVDKMPQIKIPNKFFRNNHDLTFADLTSAIGEDRATYSNGAAYADLDNDGDLDIVVNNIGDPPFVYQNMTMEQDSVAGNYIAFEFEGSAKNRQGIGARIIIRRPSGYRSYEHFPVRGYQSSMAPGLHIGLGKGSDVAEMQVVWPDGTSENISSLAQNRSHTLTWKSGLPTFDVSQIHSNSGKDFEDITDRTKLEFTHEENPFVEFNREGLMPHMVSSEGPAVAVGDVNGDGLDDVFLGSAKRIQSAIFLQRAEGKFQKMISPALINDSLFEDVDAVFVDLENDGDLDLIIAAGGNEYRGASEARKQRAYLNDGTGQFERLDIFPEIFVTAACILAEDIDQDGYVDFFIGGRAVPDKYGEIPDSYLLRNKGNLQFEDVTDTWAPDLRKVGLVKDGNWTDIDGDQDLDLVLAVEWEPLQVFLNDQHTFTQSPINDLKGWWNTVLPHDFDGDGDMDLLAGNLGENARFKPTKKQPIRMYVEDYDDNEQIEQVLTYYVNGQEIPFANHAELIKQMAPLKKKFLYAQDLAAAPMADIFGKEKLAKAVVFEANYFKSAYFENTGNGEWKTHALPAAAQFSTLESAKWIGATDAGAEVLIGGNFYDCNIEMGRYDASYGQVLRIGTNGDMEVEGLGLRVKGQVRRIQSIRIAGKPAYLWVKNNDTLQVIRKSSEL